MQSVRRLLVTTTMMVLVPAVWPAPAAGQGPRFTDPPEGAITVMGRGEVRVLPDLAVVSLGVQSRAQKLAAALSENRHKMDAVLASLRRSGVAEREIRSGGYFVEPMTRAPLTGSPGASEAERVEPQGYRVTHMVTVRTQEVQKLGPLIDGAMAAGANQVLGVSFVLEQDQEARARALALAARQARAKAEALAAALEQRLGPVSAVQEEYGVMPPAEMPKSTFAAAVQSTPITPGEVTVSAAVTVVYKLR